MDIKDKYGRKMIMIIKDQEWKEVRSSVTPAFTTGRIKRVRDLNHWTLHYQNNDFNSTDVDIDQRMCWPIGFEIGRCGEEGRENRCEKVQDILPKQ